MQAIWFSTQEFRQFCLRLLLLPQDRLPDDVLWCWPGNGGHRDTGYVLLASIRVRQLAWHWPDRTLAGLQNLWEFSWFYDSWEHLMSTDGLPVVDRGVCWWEGDKHGNISKSQLQNIFCSLAPVLFLLLLHNNICPIMSFKKMEKRQ